MDIQICPFSSSIGNYFARQRFCDVSRSGSRSRRNTTRFIRLLMMHSWISQCFDDVLRCSYDHFQTFGDCEAWLIMCPSTVNVRTVWRQHNNLPFPYSRPTHTLASAANHNCLTSTILESLFTHHSPLLCRPHTMPKLTADGYTIKEILKFKGVCSAFLTLTQSLEVIQKTLQKTS